LYAFNYPFDIYILNSLLFIIWIIAGILTINILYKNKNFLLTIFITLNIVTQVYFLFNFFYFDEIIKLGPFDFYAYKKEYIQEVSNIMFIVFGINTLIWSLYSKIIFMNNRIKLNIQLNTLLEPIHKISQKKINIMIIVLLIISIVIFILTATVFEASYPYNKKMGLIILPDTIRPLLVIPFLLVYFIIKTQSNFYNTFKVLLYKLLFFFVLFYLLLIIGPRGSATGLIGLLLLFDLITDKRLSTKMLNLSLNIYILYVLILLWPSMRWDISHVGFFDAYQLSYEKANSMFDAFLSTQFYAVPMIPQTLFHFLYVNDLITRGISLDNQTFINLIPQQMPAFLESIFGSRPLNDNYLLMKHFFHGGGFFIYANAYWNGGITPLVIFTSVVAWVLVQIEKFFKNVKDSKYLIPYPIFIYLLPVNTFYGIQPFVRGLEYGLVGILIIYLYTNLRIK